MKRPAILVLALSTLLLGFFVSSGRSTAQSDERPAFVPGQVIVRFQPGVTREQISDFYAQYGLAEKGNLDRDPTDTDEEMRLAASPVDIDDQLIELLENDPRVVYAEPNYLLQISETPPSDPLFDKLWGLHNTGQTGGTADADTDALEAWEINTGSREVIVAIIDTGIDYTHEDLASQMWVNPKECPKGLGKCEADGKDDDNNGFVDDFYGVNMIDDSGDPMDDFGHGSHVAGTIGAASNKVGVVGINWNVRFVGCKFLSAFGSGTTANAVRCFNYIHDLKNKQKQNILVTNNSWGGGGFSQALMDAMGAPGSPLHICSAGNSNSDSRSYPGAYELPNIVSVAATDHEDKYASFSNYGADWVDLAAPGVNILSTVPTGRCAMCDSSGYRAANGTSMASPHVTGAAALIWAEFGSSLTNEQVKQRIISGVDSLKDRSKQTKTNGRLNVLNVLERDSTPPAAVADLTPGGVLLTKILLNWTASGDDGMEGRATAYDIRYSQAPISEANFELANRVLDIPEPQAAGFQESVMVGGLAPSTTYYFAIKVADNVGNRSELSNVVLARTSSGTIVFEDDMESGDANWTTDDKKSLWHLSSLRFNSPATAWYYGRDKERNYDTGDANSGTVTSKAIEIVGADEALLSFYEWSQVQVNERFDRTRVQVSTDGKSWQTVFESHGTSDEWRKRQVSLTEFLDGGNSVQVRFWFDTITGSFNEYEGWYIDDVQVLTAKLALPGQEKTAPNLVIQTLNIGFNPASPTDGQAVTVNATILNNGSADARGVMVQFVDATGETPVPIGQPQTVAEVAAGSSGIARISYDTDGLCSPPNVGGAGGGSCERKIQVIVDPNNFIPESNEADNRATRALTVTPAPAPNLYVSSSNIGFDPSPANAGAQVTIYATILNTGDADAADVLVQFFDATTSSQTTPIGTPQSIDLIPAGGSGRVQVTFDTSGFDADRRIRVDADPNNFIAESKETDNSTTKSLDIEPPAAPNLTLPTGNVGVSPSTPSAGDEVRLTATVLNRGSVDAVDVLVQFLDATTSPALPIGQQQTIASIPAGSSGVAEVIYDTTNACSPPAAGRGGGGCDRKLEVVVDPHNFIAETSESDNKSRLTVAVTPLSAPNLSALAANIGFDPASPTAGDSVTLRATILNRGQSDATIVEVQFVDITDGGATPIGERLILPRIRAGSSALAEATYDTTGFCGSPPGTGGVGGGCRRTIQVVVDPGNFVAETDETDNAASSALSVAPPPTPNLVMLAGNIALLPPTPSGGAAVSISAVVLNNGTAGAPNVRLLFMDVTGGEATPIGTEQTIGLIGVGGSAQAQVSYQLPEGTRNRKIQVMVDANNQIREISENDNTATKLIEVSASAMPNLVILDNTIGFNPAAPHVGDPIVISAVVLNSGSAEATDVIVQFEDVTAGRPVPIGQPQTVARIPAGGSGTVQARFTPSGPAGEVKIRVVADPGNFISESEEIDNKGNRILLVAPAPTANLTVLVANIGFDPPTPVEGTTVNLLVTILNTGDADAENVLVQFSDTTDSGQRPIGEMQTIERIPAGGSGSAQVAYETSNRCSGGGSCERKIKVTVDPHAVVRESDETDNTATRALLVTATAAPNLTIPADNIGFAPSTGSGQGPAAVIDGGSVTIRVTVRNDGTAPAEGVVVQFLDVTDKDAQPIGSNQTIESIPAGGSGTAQVVYETANICSLPTMGGGGGGCERKIEVVADRNNLIAESNEKDNSAQAKFTVGVAALPNLVIKSDNIGFNPDLPASGDQVTIVATVLNDGGADAGEVIVSFVEGGTGGLPIGQPQVIDSIPAGGSASAQVTFDTSGRAGDQRVTVVVDPNNFVTETKENDNSTSKTLKMQVEPIPNLSVSSSNVTTIPANPQLGDGVIVHALIVNDGTAPARDVVVQFIDATSSSSPVPIGFPLTIDRIPAGGSAGVQMLYPTAGLCPPPAAGGDGGGCKRSIQVIADPNNFIPERSESDNKATKSLALGPGPAANLVVQQRNVGFHPAAPQEGDRVTISAVVLNDGGEEARDVAVQVLDITTADAVPVGQPQVIGLIPPGSSATVQVSYATLGKSGTRRLQVTADPNNFVPESDKADNKAIVNLTVAAPQAPNLAVLAGNVKFDPESAEIGGKVAVYATILNTGNADAHDLIVLVQDVTDNRTPQPVGTEQIIDLIRAGESGTVRVVFDNTEIAGSRIIRVIADPTDAISEGNEQDNRITKSLAIKPPARADLVIVESDIAFDPTSPVAGDPVKVTVTVANKGTADAASVVIRLADVSDGAPTPISQPVTIASIPMGGSGTAEFSYDTSGKAGERRIQAIADPANDIDESDEENNRAAKVLKVRSPEEKPPAQPNLVVTASDISFDPSSPAAGDSVTITLRLHNDGTEDVTDPLVRFEDATGDEPVLIGDVTISGTLKAGSSGDAVIIFDTTGKEGEVKIQVTADPEGAVDESNEEDNQASKTLTVGAAGSARGEQPNLVIQPADVAVSLASSASSQLVRVTATVQNRGQSPAQAISVHVMDVSSGNPVAVGGPVTLARLAPGESAPVRVLYNAAAASGQLSFQVVVDPDNAIAEGDESDNSADVAVLVSELVVGP
ncbi:MAG: S8 family serine peptidase [Caldilineaceae bacterium]|nr:S8 family serine peptidase [Caldilineaceae bacterium]